MVDRSCELLEELVRRRKSKASISVEVKHDDRTTTLVLVDGSLVSARSSEPAEPLGRVLLRKRLLTQERYLEVLERIIEARAIDKDVRIGEVAVQLGFVGADDVRACLAEQVRSLLARVFSAENPSWTTQEAADDRDRSRDFTMNVEAAFLDAVRWLDDTRKDAMGLRGARSLALAPAWDLAEIDERFELTPDEAEFVRTALAGDKTVQRLLDGKVPDGVDTYAVITALVASGAATTRAPGAAVRHDRPARRGPPSLPEWAKVDPSRAKSALAKVGSVAELKPKATHEGDPSMLADQAFFRGKDLLRKGDFKAASAEFERARDLERTSPEYQLFHRWSRHVTSGSKATPELRGELERAARAALRQNPKTALAHFVLGELLRETGDAEEARKLLRQALRMEPDLFESVRQERLRAMRLRPGPRPNDESPVAQGPDSRRSTSAPPPSSPDASNEVPAGTTEPPPVLKTERPEVVIPPAPKRVAPAKRTNVRAIVLGVVLAVVVLGGAGIVIVTRISSPTPIPPAPSPAPRATRADASDASDASDAGDAADASDAADANDAGAGVVVFPKTATGRRVYVDGKIATPQNDRVPVPCGRHTVRIGAKGREQTIDVACGGETPLP